MSSLGPWEVCRFLDFPGPVKACASEGSGSKLDRRKMFAEAKTAEDAEFGAARGDEPPAALRGRANRRRRFAKAKQLLDQELEEQRRAHEAHLAERAAKEAERAAKLRGRKPRWPNRTAVTTGPPAYAATRLRGHSPPLAPATSPPPPHRVQPRHGGGRAQLSLVAPGGQITWTVMWRWRATACLPWSVSRLVVPVSPLVAQRFTRASCLTRV